MTSFGIRVFEDIILKKGVMIKSCWRKVTNKFMTSILIRSRRGRPCEDGDRDWNDTVTTQEEGGRRKESFSLRALEGTWPY